MEKKGYVYIMTNRQNGVLYTGVTSNLEKRVWQHRHNQVAGFSSKYNCKKLVWYEHHPEILSAIEHEKQIKKGNRRRKIELIEALNPDWTDLSELWHG